MEGRVDVAMKRSTHAARSRAMRVVALLAALCVPAFALAQQVPVAIRAAILLRSLQYEKTFAGSQAPATLLILNGSKGSVDGAEVAAPMKTLASQNAAGRK